jgi:hypothetical protein
MIEAGGGKARLGVNGLEFVPQSLGQQGGNIFWEPSYPNSDPSLILTRVAIRGANQPLIAEPFVSMGIATDTSLIGDVFSQTVSNRTSIKTTLRAVGTGQGSIICYADSANLGLTELTGALVIASNTTPAVLNANTNNYSVGTFDFAAVLRVASSLAINVTGLVPTTGHTDGQIRILHNVGTFTITLTANDVLSTAANRFAIPAALALPPDACAILQYDATSLRWRCLGAFTGAAAAASTTTLYAPILMLAGM